MRNLLLITLAILALGTGNAWAEDYFNGPGDYLGALGLIDNDTLLMTGGTIDALLLGGYAVATIENTDLPIGITNITTSSYSKVNIYGGGIGDIDTWAESEINMTGGSVSRLEMHTESMSYLYGGNLGILASAQPLPPQGDPGPKGWIQLYCLEYDYDSNNNILTGLWEDNSAFNIQLDDIGIYPTYDLIEFHIIPEPASILLLGLGGLWLRKKNKR